MLNFSLCIIIQKHFFFFLFFAANPRRCPAKKMLVKAQSPDPEDLVCDICRTSISSKQQLVKHRQIHSQSWWPSTRAYGNNSLVSPPWCTLIDMYPQNSSEVLNNILGSKLTTPSKFQNTFRDEESPHSRGVLIQTNSLLQQNIRAHHISDPFQVSKSNTVSNCKFPS